MMMRWVETWDDEVSWSEKGMLWTVRTWVPMDAMMMSMALLWTCGQVLRFQTIKAHVEVGLTHARAYVLFFFRNLVLPRLLFPFLPDLFILIN